MHITNNKYSRLQWRSIQHIFSIYILIFLLTYCHFYKKTTNNYYIPHSYPLMGAVIGFITTSQLPGCAAPSVFSSEYRRTEYDEKLIQESPKYQIKRQTNHKNGQTWPNILIPYKNPSLVSPCGGSYISLHSHCQSTQATSRSPAL